jgi:hypothetical protein
MKLSSFEYLPKELYLAARRILRRRKECQQEFFYSPFVERLQRRRRAIFRACRKARELFNQREEQR